MSYTFSVYHTVKDLPLNWKQMVQNETVCKSIDIIENAGIENICNYYVVMFADQQPVFLSYFQLLQVTPVHFNISDMPMQQWGLNCALRIVKPTLLVSGNLFRHDVLFFQPVGTHHTPQQIANYYMETVNYMVSYTNASGIFLKDVDAQIAPFIQADNSYIAMQDDISMEMKIPDLWVNIQDYEQMLKHKYAQRYRKIKKSFEGITIRELTSADILQYRDEMLNLYLQVSRKQIVSMGVLNAQFFSALKEALNEHYIVCGYFLNGRLIAFSSAIIHDNEYDMNYIGFDYTVNHSYNLYFNILFHCVEMAIERRCKKLILGRTAIEAKAIAGCEPDYRYSYYKLRNVVVNWFYIRVAAYFQEQQGESWKNRHPFKSIYYEQIKEN